MPSSEPGLGKECIVKKYGNRICRCLGFLLLMAVLVAALSWALGSADFQEVGKIRGAYRGLYGEPEQTIDALYLGDSECYYSISPMEIWEDYGLATHCLSTPDKPVQLFYEFLESALQYQSPSVVILETNCIYRKATLEDILRSQVRVEVPAAANHDAWRRISRKDLGEKRSVREIDDMKGYFFGTRCVPWRGGEYMVKTDAVEPIPHYARGALDRLVTLCREKEIRLVLLSVPAPQFASWERHNALAAFAEENDLTYLDLNLMTEELGIDWAVHSRDGGDHLNHAGALLVSDYLGKWLTAQGLPDHRGEPEYAQWEISLENYHAIVAENDPDWERTLREP